jgi:integrase
MLAVQQERLAHQEAAQGGPTLRDFTARWATSYLPNLAEKTAVRYQGIIDKYLVDDAISAIPVRDVADQDIRDWLARVRLRPGRAGPTLSARSIRHIAALLRQILKVAVEWGETASNPALLVPLPSLRRNPEKIRTWRPDDVRRYCDEMARSAAPNAHFWRSVTILALTTGLRRGELAGLMWSDIDLDARTLTVRRTRLYPGTSTGPPKTAGSGRTIDLSDRALSCLRDLQRLQEDDQSVLGTAWVDTGFVLVLADGQPPNPDSITRQLRRDCARFGLLYPTIHGLRHTFATTALENNAVHVVSRILGHSDVATTLSTYAHVLPGDTAQAMENVSDRLFKATSNGRT